MTPEQPQEKSLPKCPYCDAVTPQIEVSVNGLLATFWCKDCKGILNCQLLTLPQQVQSRIHVPGGLIS